jgi:hypothetical protein
MANTIATIAATAANRFEMMLCMIPPSFAIAPPI